MEPLYIKVHRTHATTAIAKGTAPAFGFWRMRSPMEKGSLPEKETQDSTNKYQGSKKDLILEQLE